MMTLSLASESNWAVVFPDDGKDYTRNMSHPSISSEPFSTRTGEAMTTPTSPSEQAHREYRQNAGNYPPLAAYVLSYRNRYDTIAIRREFRETGGSLWLNCNFLRS
jgi:hypothetical protein